MENLQKLNRLMMLELIEAEQRVNALKAEDQELQALRVEGRKIAQEVQQWSEKVSSKLRSGLKQ